MDNAAPDIIEFVTDPQLLGLTVCPGRHARLVGFPVTAARARSRHGRDRGSLSAVRGQPCGR